MGRGEAFSWGGAVSRWLEAMGEVRMLNPLAQALVGVAPQRRRPELRSRVTPMGWTEIPFPGGRPVWLWNNHDDFVTRDLYLSGFASYEPDTLPLAVALAREAKVVVDVGAHVGTFTLCMAAANPETQVFAFEPVTQVFDRLVRNVAGNRMKGVVCVAAAVTADAGETPLFSPADELSTVASRVPRHRLSHRERPYRCDIVPSVRLDTFLEGCDVGSVDLVKIDVEQAELDVLRGMSRLLESRPHVICEVFPPEWTGPVKAEGIKRLVADLGYNVYLLTPEGPVPREGVLGDIDHWNQLFTPLEMAEVVAVFRCGREQLAGVAAPRTPGPGRPLQR